MFAETIETNLKCGIMKAIVMHGPGLADELFYEDVPKPVPGEGRVLVRIHESSVNQIDWKRV